MTEGRNEKDLSAGLFYFPGIGHTGSPDQYRGKPAAQMKYKDEKQGKGSAGGRMESMKGIDHTAGILPAICDGSCRTPCNGPPYLRLSE